MKTPAFQFYPKDFLSSADVQMMTTQEIGAYCLLLFNAWLITDQPGYLPNNETKLQRLTKLSNKDWKKVREVVFEKFPVSDCGKLRFNRRLIEEYDKQELRRLRLAENGRKGGRPQKQEGKKEEPAKNLQVNSSKPNLNQEERLSSSSSFASSSANTTPSSQEREGENEETEDLPERPFSDTAPPVPPTPPEGKLYPNYQPPSAREVVDYFQENGSDQAEAMNFYRDYAQRDWFDKAGNKMFNWQKTAHAWIKYEKLAEENRKLNPVPNKATSQKRESDSHFDRRLAQVHNFTSDDKYDADGNRKIA